MLRSIWERWQRRGGHPSPSFSRSQTPAESPSAPAVTAVLDLFRDRYQKFQGLVIRRAPGGGWCLHAVLGGNVWYCGADRRWTHDISDIGNPFKTFHGCEWYLQEWKVTPSPAGGAMTPRDA